MTASKLRIPFRVHPMLATLVEQPVHNRGWIYEEKYDGVRVLAYKEGSKVTLLSRNGKDRTEGFAKIADAIRKLRVPTLLLDGEVVVFDAAHVSRFELLQSSSGAPRYAVFDCLYRDGVDLRREPLSERRAVLLQTIKSGVLLFPSKVLDKDGLKALRAAKQSGYEGLVAKDLASPYIEARSARWLKVKIHQEDEFVIAGYTKPGGTRKHFGALLLAAYERGKLLFVGKVGTGFNEKTLASLYKTFQPLVTQKTPLVDPPRERDLVFLEPKLVAQISYQELTADRKLRQPVFLGLRDDKRAKDVVMPIAPA